MIFKENKYLDNKLSELYENNIISQDQYENAKKHFSISEKSNKSLFTIFISIGVFLIALGIITLFAVNWSHITKTAKLFISLIPIIITAIMLFITMRNDYYGIESRMKTYTSIFAPLSIVATNSLIGQIFHLKDSVAMLTFLSLIMFLPITLILKNKLSVIIYGLGIIAYFAISTVDDVDNTVILKVILLSLPLLGLNVYGYIKDRTDKKNAIMSIIHILIISMILFYRNIIDPSSWLVYAYVMYLIVILLFEKELLIVKILHCIFFFIMLLSCIDKVMFFYIDHIKYGIDSKILIVLIIALFYFTKSYKDIKEIIIGLFIILIYSHDIYKNGVFIYINVLMAVYGIYKIVLGSKEQSFRESIQGIAIIVLIVLFRFMSAELSFMMKSAIFLVCGVTFIVAAILVKKTLNKNDEKE